MNINVCNTHSKTVNTNKPHTMYFAINKGSGMKLFNAFQEVGCRRV